jgi:hypothetical protein
MGAGTSSHAQAQISCPGCPHSCPCSRTGVWVIPHARGPRSRGTSCGPGGCGHRHVCTYFTCVPCPQCTGDTLVSARAFMQGCLQNFPLSHALLCTIIKVNTFSNIQAPVADKKTVRGAWVWPPTHTRRGRGLEMQGPHLKGQMPST